MWIARAAGAGASVERGGVGGTGAGEHLLSN